MAYFVPQFLQKRIIRYALSRLDVLDTDDLDLDNLDVAWGKRSTIELRDVSLRAEKLTALWKLPGLSISHARISVLRVTIPADLYQSGIQIEAAGVKFQIVLVTEGLSTGVKSPDVDGSRQPMAPARDLPDSDRDDAPLGALPSTQDLAQSFLQENSPNDLLMSDLGGSSIRARSIYAGEENPASGYGKELSMPGFLAGFLKGVVERIAILVRDVQINFEIQIEAREAAPGYTWPKSSLEKVDFKVTIASVSFNAPDILADNASNMSKPSPALAPDGSSQLRKISIKHVELILHIDCDKAVHLTGSPSRETSSVCSLPSPLTDDIRGTRSEPSRQKSAEKRAVQAQNATSEDGYDRNEETPRFSDVGLDESRLFTHDEAASMYMSAMSGFPRQPGSSHTKFTSGKWPSDSILDSLSLLTSEDGITSSDHIRKSELQQARARDYDRRESRRERVPSSGSVSFSSSARQTLQHVPSDADASLLANRLLVLESADITLSSDIQNSNVELTWAQSVNNEDAECQPISHSSLPNEQPMPDTNIDNVTHAITLSHLELHSDMTTIKLIFLIAQRLPFTALTDSRHASGDKPMGLINTPTSHLNLKLELDNCHWYICHSLSRIPWENARSAPTDVLHGSTDMNEHVLFSLRIRDLTCSTQSILLAQKTSLSARRIYIAYEDESILEFDSSANFEARPDLNLAIEYAPTRRKTDIATNPVKLNLNLRRLEESLNWFGGLSSLMDLKKSVSSYSTKPTSRFVPDQNRKNKRIHFLDDDLGHSKTTTIVDSNKITSRIEGISILVRGTKINLRLTGTALKLVNRAEGIGMVVDRLRINGPYMDFEEDAPMTETVLLYSRFEYLHTPKEVDLDRLLSLVRPIQDGVSDAGEDTILVDTMLRQRRQGGVVRITVPEIRSNVENPTRFSDLTSLHEDLQELSSVTKYLPEDDRPGVLVLALVRRIEMTYHCNEEIGNMQFSSADLNAAYITFPSLLGVGILDLHLTRNRDEVLISCHTIESISKEEAPHAWIRFVGNAMEPTVEVKIQNVLLEYSVDTIVQVLGLNEVLSRDDMISDITDSVATLKNLQPALELAGKHCSSYLKNSSVSDKNVDLPKLKLILRDFSVRLIPLNGTIEGLLYFHNGLLSSSVNTSKGTESHINLDKVSVMLRDGREAICEPRYSLGAVTPMQRFFHQGYIIIGALTGTSLKLKATSDKGSINHFVDAELCGPFLVLETCADSTQSLIQLLVNLAPPTAKSSVPRYRTEIVPIDSMLASVIGDTFAKVPLSPAISNVEIDMFRPSKGSNLNTSQDLAEDLYAYEIDDIIQPDKQFSTNLFEEDPEFFGVEENELFKTPSAPRDLLASNKPSRRPSLDFREDHFQRPADSHKAGETPSETQHVVPAETPRVREKFLELRVRNTHLIWNMYDGYDWSSTRDTINNALDDLQAKAAERLSKNERRQPLQAKSEQPDVIGDFLFNSIYIGVSPDDDSSGLPRNIAETMDDVASMNSKAKLPTVSTIENEMSGRPRKKNRSIRLRRSRYHKMTLELKRIELDYTIFGASSQEQMQSIAKLCIQDLDIFDHVPTSTWKKFATYMRDAGERESDSNMIFLSISNLKPVPELEATELAIEVSILPLRLHVDQDALDFMSRFFEFKDDSLEIKSTKKDAVFIQRLEVHAVRIRLDFKPKRVDYAGLRSGRTTEFMNFFILDRADMVLRHVILHGVSGLDRVGKMLNDIWSPDVRQNQLPGILAGIGPVRSLTNVGGGIRDLIVVPMREYKKDGRIVRSIQKGAFAFAKTTTSELVRLGARLAIGTQNVLQGAEDILTHQEDLTTTDVAGDWENLDVDELAREQISLYADQPVGVMQGLRGAYASLESDLSTARDAIVALPGEFLESEGASGAAKTVLRAAPTLILRPAIGVTKAVGQTLMGATNALDPANRQRMEEKYKHH